MKSVIKTFYTLGISLFALSALATPPRFLITHNHTNDESNAFIAGNIASQYPTRPHSDNRVFWTAVKLACFGHIVQGECTAIIKMKTNTPQPITLGNLHMNLETGAISPTRLSAQGYTITVNNPGETTITKDE